MQEKMGFSSRDRRIGKDRDRGKKEGTFIGMFLQFSLAKTEISSFVL